jgi:hypothetical protein
MHLDLETIWQHDWVIYTQNNSRMFAIITEHQRRAASFHVKTTWQHDFASIDEHPPKRSDIEFHQSGFMAIWSDLSR